MLEYDGGVEAGFELDLEAVKLWVSPGLAWLAAPEYFKLPDDFGFVLVDDELGDRWVSLRVASAEWLGWLRLNCKKGRDPRSIAVIESRMPKLAAAIKIYAPHLAGVKVDVPAGYEPPALDSVTNARL